MPAHVQTALPATPGSDDWYADLLVFDWRKCLLLTHAGTLFTIFEPDLRASDLRSTHALVAGLIERQLVAEALPLETFGDFQGDPLLIAKTADRRVLGCTNDIAFLCEVTVADASGLARVNIPSLNHRLHRNINGARDYQRPIDLAMEWVAR